VIYEYTAAEQASRDIASALRGIRNPSEAPAIIVSMVLRELPEDDDSAATTWFDHATRPSELPAKCHVKFTTAPSGAVFVDVTPMMAELVANIERCRAELNPEMVPVVVDEMKVAA